MHLLSLLFIFVIGQCPRPPLSCVQWSPVVFDATRIRFVSIRFRFSLLFLLFCQANPIPRLKLSLWLFCCFSIARRVSSAILFRIPIRLFFGSGSIPFGRFIAPRRRRCHLRRVLTRDMFSSHLFFPFRARVQDSLLVDAGSINVMFGFMIESRVSFFPVLLNSIILDKWMRHRETAIKVALGETEEGSSRGIRNGKESCNSLFRNFGVWRLKEDDKNWDILIWFDRQPRSLSFFVGGVKSDIC